MNIQQNNKNQQENSTTMSADEMAVFVEQMIAHCEYADNIISGFIFLLNSFQELVKSNPLELQEHLIQLKKLAYQNGSDFEASFDSFIHKIKMPKSSAMPEVRK